MTARYESIDAQKVIFTTDGAPIYTVVKVCAWLDVSTSGFYEWLIRPVLATAERRE